MLIPQTRKSSSRQMHSQGRLIPPNSDLGEPGKGFPITSVIDFSTSRLFMLQWVWSEEHRTDDNCRFENSNDRKTENGIFSPALSMTNSMLARIIYRLLGLTVLSDGSHYRSPSNANDVFTMSYGHILTRFQSDD
jgi:hypothetical protein